MNSARRADEFSYRLNATGPEPRTARLRALLLGLFTLSGFTGLIYESLWSHYIKLMLGHAALAQSLVLVIYMGGLALGAWLASRSERWRRPLLAYAAIELTIAIAGFAFHGVFVASDRWLHDALLPTLGSPTLGAAARWTVAALLLLPQAILLGMTFPLMSAGVLRLDPSRVGSTIGTLYFTNCLGAALGPLVAVFVMVPRLGLAGALLVASTINAALAFAVWLAVRRRDEGAAPARAAGAAAPRVAPRVARLVLIAAALTGLASFCYEIAWIRMLALVLGSTTQAFEMMLSAFILGLALGGLWVRRRADAVPDPLLLAGWVQLAMGAAAAATLPLYGWTFEAMATLFGTLVRNDAGYAAFLGASHMIALGVMLPATVLAGMTLPLFTAALLRGGAGERAIGRVYAANTLGCILGALLAQHLMLPLLGLHGTVLTGALIDTTLGAALLWATLARGTAARRRPLLTSAATLVLLVAVATVGGADPRRRVAGVYRTGEASLPPSAELVYLRDGATATVSLVRVADGTLRIATNGKIDASIAPESAPHDADEDTMVVMATLALVLHPDARSVANIGLGSGLSTHTLLGAPWIERVDTIEIEPAIVEAARGFGPAVRRTFEDPRSRIHIDDAKAWLATSTARYDLIVSEPSNPWVSGVANLFTYEFYGRIRQHLAPGGRFVQWLQLYETDFTIAASVFRALGAQFDDYAAYLADDLNLLVVASDAPLPQAPAARALEAPALQESLARIGLGGVDDLQARRIGSKRTLAPLFETVAAPRNSDFRPFVALEAPRARFLNRHLVEFTYLASLPVPLTAWLEQRAPALASAQDPHIQVSRQARRAQAALRALQADGGEIALAGELDRAVGIVRLAVMNCAALDRTSQALLDDALRAIAREVTLGRDRAERVALWHELVPVRCRARWPGSSVDWYRLHEAVAQDRPNVAAEVAARLLAARAYSDRAALDHLAAAAAAGRLASGDPRGAAQVLAEHGARLLDGEVPPLHLRWLAALAAAP